MFTKTRLIAALATIALTTWGVTRADDVKPIDEGKGAEFKSKKYDLKDKAELAILLSFEAGKEIEATTDGTKETDVHLFIYDDAGKEVGKDVSPGPKCSVKFTPTKAGKFKLVIKNAKGDNQVTIAIKVAK